MLSPTIVDQSRKEGDSPVIANSKTLVVLEFSEDQCLGLIWWSGWKVGEIHFWNKSGSKLPLPQTQNNPKTWFTIYGLRYECPSDSRRCQFFFFYHYNDRFAWFSISWKLLVVERLLLKMIIRMGFTLGDLRYVYTSDNWKCPKNTFFYFYFFDFIWWKFYISRCCLTSHSPKGKWP